MPGLLPDVDPDGLLEYSVVFTDRSLNHMSQQFQQVMRDISTTLKQVYNAHSVTVVPGGGTYAMESVARQFAHNKKCLVLRNGWFSFRWSQIFEMGNIPDSHQVLMATPISDQPQSPFEPAPIEEVVNYIKQEKPDLVFAPHVETASGIMLNDGYIRAVGEAVQQTGGLFILDCVASGTVWVDMQDCHVDVLISAPQKGWSASPCSGLVMLSENAHNRLKETQSSSFACDLGKWRWIMEAYENGGHAYHATMPTDALKRFRDTMKETEVLGFDMLKAKQLELGEKVRALFAEQGFQSVAADGFGAPGVAVFFTQDDDMKTGKPFLAKGLQVAAGVPLQCNESADFKTFRIGLFDLDKLQNVDRTVATLETALKELN